MSRDGVIEIGKPGDIGHAVGLQRQAGNATMCRGGEQGAGRRKVKSRKGWGKAETLILLRARLRRDKKLNGANGMSDMHGKAARVAGSKSGDGRMKR
jgi:hypothetical protein